MLLDEHDQFRTRHDAPAHSSLPCSKCVRVCHKVFGYLYRQLLATGSNVDDPCNTNSHDGESPPLHSLQTWEPPCVDAWITPLC